MISNQTQKNINALLNHSFTEMLRLSKHNQNIVIKEIAADLADDGRFKSTMFTVSSSDFRLVFLLHFLPKNRLSTTISQDFNLELLNDDQQYLDYVCELGNNFCGVACRILGAGGLSTGMSTPNILANAHSIPTMRSVGIDYETHIGAFSGNAPVFCASMCLFVNQGAHLELHLSIPTLAQENENLGELEFF